MFEFEFITDEAVGIEPDHLGSGHLHQEANLSYL